MAATQAVQEARWPGTSPHAENYKAARADVPLCSTSDPIPGVDMQCLYLETWLPFRRPANIAMFVEGMRKAGMTEMAFRDAAILVSTLRVADNGDQRAASRSALFARDAALQRDTA